MILLLEAGLGGGAFALLCSRVDPMRRLLIPRWAMRTAVDTASHATFSQENTSLTKDRNALLLYVSVLEGEVRLMPDIGVIQKLPQGALGEMEGNLRNATSGDATQLVCDAIGKLAAHCKDCFPYASDDANELPDRPQIRLP
jgi:putative membrane protein